MKIRLLFLALILLQSVQAQTHKRVYFIGNSYTGNNNLPLLIKNVAQAQGNTFSYESHTPGGSNFFQHSFNQTVLNKLNQGTWDHVVLQEQSQTPTFPDGQVSQTMFPQAQTLVQTAKNANACTVPIFYMTWGYKYGDASNCPYLPYVCNYEDMDDVIAYRYMQLGQANQSLVSPVGRVWRAIRNQFPNYELYASDNSHPSLLGSMAAAYTFYTIIYKEDPTNITYTNGLTAQQAIEIKNIVKRVVYDQLDAWFVGTHDNPTKFAFTQNGSEVTFTNQTVDATTFTWDFNDGNTTTEENPTHIFTQNGTYNVTLTTNACGKTTSYSTTITVSNLSVSDFKVEPIIYPNPVTDIITINHPEIKSVALYTINGKLINAKVSPQNTINLQGIAAGFYILKVIDNNNKVFTQKIIKQ